MKFFTLLLVLGFVYYTLQQADPQFAQQFQAALTACLAETGVTQDQLDKITPQTWTAPNVDNKLKCFKKCMFLKLGVMDNSGEIIDDGLGKLASHYVNATTDIQIMKNCKDAEGPDRSDLCAVAFSLVKCIWKTLAPSG